ncbi:unnamed protein product [Didymodactylos carnosus]|uniref:Uncharacterized protein n=1 Tax=Didymodactylos carnosus TaxID=1234261 RepID=A0A815VGM8_9BILA|nr:unnamed protein product [Didymodactylos carnosus]CAF4391521.1 unnamed protein product [Didymodactylos carnosus]
MSGVRISVDEQKAIFDCQQQFGNQYRQYIPYLRTNQNVADAVKNIYKAITDKQAEARVVNYLQREGKKVRNNSIIKIHVTTSSQNDEVDDMDVDDEIAQEMPKNKDLQHFVEAADVFEHDSLDGSFTGFVHRQPSSVRRVVTRQTPIFHQTVGQTLQVPSAVNPSASYVQPLTSQQPSKSVTSGTVAPPTIANQQQTAATRGNRTRRRDQAARQSQQHTNDVNQHPVDISVDNASPTRADHPTRTTITGMIREAISHYDDFSDTGFRLYDRMLDEL